MKKFFCFILSFIAAFSVTACKSTKQEIEKLGLVLAVGYDLTAENKYKLTMQILNTEDLSQSTSGKQNPSGVMIFSSEGDTPYDAINHLSINYGRNLFLGHIRYLVIGNRLAETGISTVCDAMLRGQQARPDGTLLLARDTASKVLSFQPIDEKIPADSVINLIKLQATRGYSPIVTRLDFANALSSKTTAPIMGVIDIDEKNNLGKAFNLSGTGIFKKGKLIGYLNINETRGMQWINGKVQDGVMASTFKDNKITFFILNANTKIKPIVEGDNAIIKINIKAESDVLEMTADLDPIKNPQIMDELGELQSKEIEKEIQLALNAAQKKFRADIFGFGELIHKAYPKQWSKLEANWDKIFPNIRIQVNVESTIKNSGVIDKPLKPQ